MPYSKHNNKLKFVEAAKTDKQKEELLFKIKEDLEVIYKDMVDAGKTCVRVRDKALVVSMVTHYYILV